MLVSGAHLVRIQDTNEDNSSKMNAEKAAEGHYRERGVLTQRQRNAARARAGKELQEAEEVREELLQ